MKAPAAVNIAMIPKPLILTALFFLFAIRAAAAEAPAYAVVASNTLLKDKGWKEVVDTLVAKHGGVVIRYDTLDEARSRLTSLMPRYACFVAKPREATKDFVAKVHKLTRALDDDPYTDLIWGILTGFNAENALTIAKTKAPLEIRRVASGTEIPLERCEEGIWYSELEAGHFVVKKPGGKPTPEKGPTDSTRLLVEALNDYHADAFITSGHATERDWQIGFRYPNGVFRSNVGKLYGLDTKGQKHPVHSPNPKVYLAVGNCLMGHIDGKDAMALAFLQSAGVHQMIGYTDLTWFGYGGWGVLDYFIEQPGRFSLAEAFHANHLALLHKLQTQYPADAKKESSAGTRNGLLYDRDIVAFYGDPAWDARLKSDPVTSVPCGWKQELKEESNGEYTFTITPTQGKNSFKLLSMNGSQRGGRPAITFLPHRIRDITITEGKDLAPVITDNFILVPLPNEADPERVYRVRFTAQKLKS